MIAALHRRHFLATGGAAAATGVQASTPLLNSLGTANPRWRILAIAPSSAKLPELTRDYQQGVELGLAQAGASSHVALTWLTAGLLPSAPAKAVGAALQATQFDAVMGWMPPALANKVSPLTESAGVPLWISDTGADLVSPSDTHPLTVRHSLELCAMATALADRVYAQCGPRAFLSMGRHESGFDFLQSFQQRWHALGGQVVGRHIADMPNNASEFGGLKQSIISHQPDAVIALYSGPQSKRFAQWWQKHSAALRTNLAGLPWLPEHNPGVHAHTIATWPQAESADAGWKARVAQAGLGWRAAALLGAEAGATLGTALVAAPQGTHMRDLWAGLHHTPLVGPRGERRWANAATDSAGPLWENTFLGVSARRQPPTSHPTPAAVVAQRGWTTGYLLT